MSLIAERIHGVCLVFLSFPRVHWHRRTPLILSNLSFTTNHSIQLSPSRRRRNLQLWLSTTTQVTRRRTLSKDLLGLTTRALATRSTEPPFRRAIQTLPILVFPTAFSILPLRSTLSPISARFLEVGPSLNSSAPTARLYWGTFRPISVPNVNRIPVPLSSDSF